MSRALRVTDIGTKSTRDVRRTDGNGRPACKLQSGYWEQPSLDLCNAVSRRGAYGVVYRINEAERTDSMSRIAVTAKVVASLIASGAACPGSDLYLMRSVQIL
jgi:hypothetical protein